MAGLKRVLTAVSAACLLAVPAAGQQAPPSDWLTRVNVHGVCVTATRNEARQGLVVFPAADPALNLRVGLLIGYRDWRLRPGTEVPARLELRAPGGAPLFAERLSGQVLAADVLRFDLNVSERFRQAFAGGAELRLHAGGDDRLEFAMPLAGAAEAWAALGACVARQLGAEPYDGTPAADGRGSQRPAA